MPAKLDYQFYPSPIIRECPGVTRYYLLTHSSLVMMMRGKRENVQISSLNSSTTQLAGNISFVNIQICTTNKERYIACKEILPWKLSVFYKKVWSNIWTFIGKQTRGRYKQTGLRSDYNLEIDIIDRFWWSSWIIAILIQYHNKDEIS